MFVNYRQGSSLCANLVIRFPFVNISYTSHVTLIEPYLVTAVCKGTKSQWGVALGGWANVH